MAADDAWVEEVRRWCLSGRRDTTAGCLPPAEDETQGEAEAVGYEAADPPLQARHWPDSRA
jgi:hypothetical protein